ncbi:MAG: monofunctional biosynthetic peptidoglycan transglycosylase [Paludibacteraceae bacterium]|nr:monofunctional biosynthetic peptidoglycan transglycosylase [Paludibacteraceae bacterium]
MKKLFRWIGRILLGYFILSILLVVVLKWVPVYYTPLMFVRQNVEPKATQPFARQWKPLEEIDPDMVRAVIASEDGKFIRHHGFDWNAIGIAYKYNQKSKNGKIRGGSTISQQTAKNVFTFHSRSGVAGFIRKGLETYYTVLIELIWGKERIMEVYLNIVELGNNVFGVEAASKKYFGHSAKNLTNYEAASLAAVLPSPRYYRVVNPTPGVQKRVNRILETMKHVGRIKWN